VEGEISDEFSNLAASAGPPARPRLLDQVRATIRRKYYSRRTEEAYVHWIRRFIYFTGKRHPATVGEPEVTTFLSDLAVRRHVAAATQNQALSALLFLYREVLGQELGWLDGLQRATRPPRLPTVLTREEAARGGRSVCSPLDMDWRPPLARFSQANRTGGAECDAPKSLSTGQQVAAYRALRTARARD
jgi:hypothetical protein